MTFRKMIETIIRSGPSPLGGNGGGGIGRGEAYIKLLRTEQGEDEDKFWQDFEASDGKKKYYFQLYTEVGGHGLDDWSFSRHSNRRLYGRYTIEELVLATISFTGPHKDGDILVIDDATIAKMKRWGLL